MTSLYFMSTPHVYFIYMRCSHRGRNFRGAVSSQRWGNHLRYSLHVPTEGWPGWVGLIDLDKYREVVTNLSTNQAPCSLTLLMWQTPLSLRQTSQQKKNNNTNNRTGNKKYNINTERETMSRMDGWYHGFVQGGPAHSEMEGNRPGWVAEGC